MDDLKINDHKIISFGEAIDKYDLGYLPNYIVENYSNDLLCVFENDAYFNILEIDALVLNHEFNGVLFRKNLTVDTYILQEEMDYGPLIIVQGDVKAKNIFISGSDCYFRGNVMAEQTLVCGVYNHGELSIEGIIEAELLMSFDHSFEFRGSNIKKGIVLGLEPSRENPEFQKYNIEDVLDKKYFITDEDYINEEAVLTAIKKGQSLLRNTKILTPVEKRILNAQKLKIKKINLSGLDLKEIPPSVFEITDLVELDLSGNYITELPEEILKFKKLQKIDLFNCEFTEFPKILFQIPMLKEIGLSKNSVSEIPPEITKLLSLKKLDLYECNFTVFPEVLFQVESLEEINLSYQEQQPAFSINKSLPNLKILKINANFGTTVEVSFPKLEKLNYRNCSLKEFPLSITECKSLKVLDITLNRRIVEFPKEIGNLQNLQEFHFSISEKAIINFMVLNELPELRKIHIHFDYSLPKHFLDILNITQWTEIFIEGDIENLKIWKKLLCRKNLKKIVRVSSSGEEVIDIEKGKKELGILF